MPSLRHGRSQRHTLGQAAYAGVEAAGTRNLRMLRPAQSPGPTSYSLGPAADPGACSAPPQVPGQHWCSHIPTTTARYAEPPPRHQHRHRARDTTVAHGDAVRAGRDGGLHSPWRHMGTLRSHLWTCRVGPHPSTPHLAASRSHKLKFHLLRPGRLRLHRERAAPVTPPAPITRRAILLREQVPQPPPRPLGWPQLCHTTTSTALAWLHRCCL